MDIFDQYLNFLFIFLFYVIMFKFKIIEVQLNPKYTMP